MVVTVPLVVVKVVISYFFCDLPWMAAAFSKSSSSSEVRPQARSSPSLAVEKAEVNVDAFNTTASRVIGAPFGPSTTEIAVENAIRMLGIRSRLTETYFEVFLPELALFVIPLP